MTVALSLYNFYRILSKYANFYVKEVGRKTLFWTYIFYFKEGEKATEQKNCVIYGEGTVYNQARQK